MDAEKSECESHSDNLKLARLSQEVSKLSSVVSTLKEKLVKFEQNQNDTESAESSNQTDKTLILLLIEQ